MLLVFVTTINSLLTFPAGKFGINPVVLHIASQSWEVLLENEREQSEPRVFLKAR